MFVRLSRKLWYIYKMRINKIDPNKLYYFSLPFSQLIANWIFQRVLGIHKDIPYSIHFTSRIDGFHNICINGNPQSVLKSFAVSGGCYFGIANGSKLSIGEGTIWAFNLNVQTSNHSHEDLSKSINMNIEIGKNCWIAGNCTITAGVKLGNNVIVGANSVVTRSFPDNSIIGGCPAKVLNSTKKPNG
jgi:acetyltransferase-like isoleucine patch superfamily enzyme